MDPSIPETRYCVVDGDHIAYQVLGSGPVDLVYMSGFAGQIDLRWDLPAMREMLLGLAGSARVVLYDRRGVGASDAPSRPLTWEDWSRDLGAVLDAVGSVRCVPIGVFDAGASALLFAAQHPRRVRGVVLHRAFAKLGWSPDHPVGPSGQAIDEMFDAIASTWGRRGSAFSWFLPSGSPAEHWQLRLQRAAASPAAIRRHLDVVRRIDARSALPLVQCPVLLLRGGRTTGKFDAAMQYLHDHLLDVREHVLAPSAWALTDDVAAVSAIVDFATGAPPAVPVRRLLTVAFVDVVGSTPLASAIGDRAWRGLLVDLERVMGDAVATGDGAVVKSTGDGVLVTFDGPAAAVRTLLTVVGTVAERFDVRLRVGVHTGEIEVRHDDVAGIAVHLAARITEAAAPGEVLVSRTVRDLVAGSELRFGVSRSFTPRGFDAPWEVHPATA